MRAIILAAGRGSRMGRLCAHQPKCLTILAGKSLLDWQLAALRAAGIQDLAVVRGYRLEKLTAPGLKYFDNRRWKETNMVSSLACADKWLSEETCIVSYADIVYHADIIKNLADADGNNAEGDYIKKAYVDVEFYYKDYIEKGILVKHTTEATPPAGQVEDNPQG